jgi:hypothetical protein
MLPHTTYFPDLLNSYPTRPQHSRRLAESIHHGTLDPNLTCSTIEDQLDPPVEIMQDVGGGGGAGSGGCISGWSCERAVGE